MAYDAELNEDTKTKDIPAEPTKKKYDPLAYVPDEIILPAAAEPTKKKYDPLAYVPDEIDLPVETVNDIEVFLFIFLYLMPDLRNIFTIFFAK
jgi:hypothetical protein